MKLRTLRFVYLAIFVLGGLFIRSRDSAAILLIAWILVFAIAQFFVFRCPYCDAYAYKANKGRWFRSIGTRCRNCGEPY